MSPKFKQMNLLLYQQGIWKCLVFFCMIIEMQLES
jgi:hypothetical protein